MSYDEDTQEITISDIPAGTPSNEIKKTVRYDLPVSGNEFKIGELRVKAYVKEKVRRKARYFRPMPLITKAWMMQKLRLTKLLPVRPL